jgi:hypothetical protein
MSSGPRRTADVVGGNVRCDRPILAYVTHLSARLISAELVEITIQLLFVAEAAMRGPRNGPLSHNSR